jgi:hypothetical protein
MLHFVLAQKGLTWNDDVISSYTSNVLTKNQLQMLSAVLESWSFMDWIGINPNLHLKLNSF